MQSGGLRTKGITKHSLENKPLITIITVVRNGEKTLEDKPCCTQLIEAYEEINEPVVSICEVALQEVGNFGIISAQWTDDTRKTMRVTHFLEKPDSDYVERHLSNYYSIFGRYILTPEVFRELEKNIHGGRTRNDEYQLTDAIAAMIDKSVLYAFMPGGKMLDMGNVEAFRKAAVGRFS